MNPIMRFALKFLKGRMEKAGAARSYAEHAAMLEKTGAAVNARVARAADSAKNRNQLAHIIGIERWGQRRLRVALGEPPTSDEYDAYRPVTSATWEALLREFADTRAETVRITRELDTRGVDRAHIVAHNAFGELSVGGWLSYLDAHAERESHLLR